MQDHATSHHDCGYETAPFLFQELPKNHLKVISQCHKIMELKLF